MKNITRLFSALIAIAILAFAVNMTYGYSFAATFAVLLAFSIGLSFVPQTAALFETVVPPAGEKENKEGKENETEIKSMDDLLKQLNEMKSGLETKAKEEAKTEAKNLIEAKMKEVDDKIKEVKGLPEGVTGEQLVKALDDLKVTIKAVDKFQNIYIKGVKAAPEKTVEQKSFNQILGETIERNAEEIKNFRRLAGNKGTNDASFSFYTEEEQKSRGVKNDNGQYEVKAVGDMTMAVNFPGGATLYQDVRNLVQNPYNKVYIADLLPNASSGGSQIGYPKETDGDGSVDSWTDYSSDKAQLDFNISGKTSPFVWGAGYVIVQRDMLDDIPFMTSYLQSRLLISLKNWENTFILNGGGGVDGLQTLASDYDGDFSAPVDRILDAAWGQIVDDTKEWYMGNLAILRSRDLVKKVGLNKASGSGEYDLPPGAVVLNANGSISIGNMQVVGTTSIPEDTFYSLDTRATAFIRRIVPELRMFEDATLAKKNQVMFRIEERSSLIVYNDKAIVKGVTQLS